MAIIVLTSANGSPGVTTTAVGLVLHWPESAMLIDADYQQAVLAGTLAGQVVPSQSLSRVIDAGRLTPNLEEAIWKQTVPFPEDGVGDRRRLLLPGVREATEAGTLWSTWPSIASSLGSIATAGIDVVIDLGRLTPAGIHPDLMEVATDVVLMTRPTLRSIAGCRWAAALLARQANEVGDPGRASIVLQTSPTVPRATTAEQTNRRLRPAGPNVVEYRQHRISAELGLQIRGSVLRDVVHAQALSDGLPRKPRWARSAYAGSLQRLAERLNARARRQPASA